LSGADKSLFSLAERLHKTVEELKAMPFSEFLGWCEYFSDESDDKSMDWSDKNAVGAFLGGA